jgi:LacI family transcriptional regulator
MNRLPRKIPLSVQTSIAIMEEIAIGRWDQWLPGEHELSSLLHVSRRTVRAALEQLRRDGVVECRPGTRREIIRRKPEALKPASSRAILLTPVPLHLMNPFSIFLIDRLREHLGAEGYSLEIHAGREPYRTRRPQQLKKLEETLRPAAWVLTQSTASMQHWFARCGLPCVVVGSSYPGVALPSVDFDYAAVCRHAVGQFLARGHRRIVLLNPRSRAAGDMKGEEGFLQAVKNTSTSNVEATIDYHDGTVANVRSRLEALMRLKERPTALLVSRAHHFVAVLGHLLVNQFRVPDDVAVISRDDDSYLENIVPLPARYSGNPELFASTLSRVVLEAISGRKPATEHRLMPKFFPGQTLGNH